MVLASNAAPGQPGPVLLSELELVAIHHMEGLVGARGGKARELVLDDREGNRYHLWWSEKFPVEGHIGHRLEVVATVGKLCANYRGREATWLKRAKSVRPSTQGSLFG